MERYLFAFDMDGTLLNKKEKILSKTKRLLRKLSKQGHVIVLASGRPSRALKSYYNELKLTSPMICYNGAYCFSPKDPHFPVHEFEFPKEIVKSICKDIRPYIENIMCETDKDIWVDQEDTYLDKFFWYDQMNVHKGDLLEILNEDPMTMIAKFVKGKEQEEAIVKEIAKYPEIDVRFWTGSPYFELFYPKTSKGASLKTIAKYYHIEKKNIVVFGDASNDVEMFNEAGVSIAMSNGKDSCKEFADYISLRDNNHNGIYYTIKALLKGKLM